MEQEKEPCLIIVFADQLKVGKIDCVESGSPHFFFGNELFECKKDDDGFNGYYDWLRTSTGDVIGLRYVAFEHLDFLTSLLFRYPYVEIQPDSRKYIYLSVYFSDSRDFDESSSIDQDFGYNWVFTGKSGLIAMSFSTNNVPGVFESAQELSVG